MTDWLKFRIVFQVHLCNGLLLLSVVFLLFSCTEKAPEIVNNQNVGAALGTSYNISYIADKEVDYQQEIDSVFRVVNQSMSTYIADSDITKINKGDATLEVDAMFEKVFELSKEVYESTNGYFDPTVGVLVDAWGFGPGKQIELDSARVDSLMNYVGFDKVFLTPQRTIRKENPNIQFDFNAIAKGYAIDRLAVLFDQKQLQHYLIELGGEVVAKGENIVKKRPWSVGVTDPEKKEAKLAVHLNNRAMASSGNYRKFRIDSLTGKKYVHTINPKTGFTKNGNTLGVNILAASCAEADAYATAFMAMDVDEVVKLLTRNRSLEAYIIYLDEKGKTQEFMTSGFEKVLRK